MEKIKAQSEAYQTKGGNTAYRIFSGETHIKTTSALSIHEFISENKYTYVETEKKAVTEAEKTAIMLDRLRNEIGTLYRDYPAIKETIKGAAVVSRNKYSKTLESDQPKYGVSFENGASIYIPERLFHYLDQYPVKYLNA